MNRRELLNTLLVAPLAVLGVNVEAADTSRGCKVGSRFIMTHCLQKTKNRARMQKEIDKSLRALEDHLSQE